MDNGTTFLKCLDGYIFSENSQEKKNSNFYMEIITRQFLLCRNWNLYLSFGWKKKKKKIYEYKNKQLITYLRNKCGNHIMKEIYFNMKNYRIIKTVEIHIISEYNGMETDWVQKIYKK